MEDNTHETSITFTFVLRNSNDKTIHASTVYRTMRDLSKAGYRHIYKTIIRTTSDHRAIKSITPPGFS